MDRATRFLWEMHCGRKERKLFKHAMALLGKVIQQTSLAFPISELGLCSCGFPVLPL
jgi:hypothetical protein